MALIVAAGAGLVNDRTLGSPEQVVQMLVLYFGIVFSIPIGLYVLIKNASARYSDLSMIIVGSAFVVLTASYLFWVSEFIRFPADILIWSENDFVNDILKFRHDYPLFTTQANNESFTYVPGPQLLTYFVASLIGLRDSIPTYRAIQLLYTLLSAGVGLLCCRRLIQVESTGQGSTAYSPLWSAVVFLGLFLVASNGITNPFVHLLHDDALAQLTVAFAYWLLLEFEAKQNTRLLWLMAIVPGLAFWVKQSLIVWALIYAIYLWGFSDFRKRPAKVLFTLATFGGVILSFGIGWILWHEHFVYWIITVLGAHGVSPLRSAMHVLDIWVYLAGGLLAGVLLNVGRSRKFTGLWISWLFLILLETYTSGVAWMLNHIGPGTLLAGVWIFAALTAKWGQLFNGTLQRSNTRQRFIAATSLATICLALNAFGLIHPPIRPFGDDAYRYVSEIEEEFSGGDRDRILLDMGTWVYLPEGIVMKDRAPSIGERGYSQTGDFSGILSRINSKFYEKILVRNLHSDDFWYDHGKWKASSHIREALMKNYVEVRTIQEVSGFEPDQRPYGFSEIAVLRPKSD